MNIFEWVSRSRESALSIGVTPLVKEWNGRSGWWVLWDGVRRVHLIRAKWCQVGNLKERQPALVVPHPGHRFVALARELLYDTLSLEPAQADLGV